MAGNPSRFRGADLPVDSVSVAECLEFLGRLNRMPETKAAGLAFRLPTKAEWYRAAAGAPRTLDSSEMYRDEAEWMELGWFRGNAGGATHPVGQKPPSKAGLFDLWGNVAEPTMSVARGERFSEDKVWFYWFCCMGGSVRKAVPSVDTDGIRSIGGDVGSVPGEFQSMFDGLEVPQKAQRRLAPDDDGRLTYVGELLGLRLFAERVALDLRLRILAVCDQHEHTQREVAKRFCVSFGFVKKLLGQRRHLGVLDNLYCRVGRKRSISEDKQEEMRRFVQDHPGATLEEIARACHLSCCLATVDNTLRRMGLTYKKRHSGLPSKTAKT